MIGVKPQTDGVRVAQQTCSPTPAAPQWSPAGQEVQYSSKINTNRNLRFKTFPRAIFLNVWIYLQTAGDSLMCLDKSCSGLNEQHKLG